jgi:hypothetical protein
MANIGQHTDTTGTRQRVMALRETEAQRLRVQWAIAAEDKKRRHKEALEYARRTPIDGEKVTSNVIIG